METFRLRCVGTFTFIHRRNVMHRSRLSRIGINDAPTASQARFGLLESLSLHINDCLATKTMLSNRLLPTLEDSVGPYYPPNFLDADRMDLTAFPGTVLKAAGQPVVLTGELIEASGARVVPALIEFWVADAEGRYRVPGSDPDPWFEGSARCYSEDGSFALRTVMPGAVGNRAPCVTLSIFCDGISRVATQIFFEGDPRNVDDALLASLPENLRGRLVARRDGEADGALRYHIAIVLRGEGETPFFDDLAADQ